MRRLEGALCAVLCLTLGTPVLLGTATAAADPPAASVAELDRAIYAAERESRRLLALLDERRVRHDARGERCVDVRLAQVNSFSRMLVDRRRRLAEADAHDVPREQAVTRRMVRQLREAARAGRACVYGGSPLEDGTIVEVIIEAPVVASNDLSRVPERGQR